MQNKHLLKNQVSFIICLHSGNFFPCYTSQIHKSKNHIFLLKRLTHPNSQESLSSSSDARTYYQIETPSYNIIVGGRNVEASINHHSSSNF